MANLNEILNELKGFENESLIISYWRKNDKSIQKQVIDSDDKNAAIEVLYRITKALNRKERYSDIYYIHSSTYALANFNLKPYPYRNELKYELAYGLHHNRKYNLSKSLLNELENADFDLTKANDWRAQTEIGADRIQKLNKSTFRSIITPFIGLAAIAFAIIITEEYILVLTIALLISEFFWFKRFNKTQLVENTKENIQSIKKQFFIIEGLVALGALLLIATEIFTSSFGRFLIVVLLAYFQFAHFGISRFYSKQNHN
jgi:hypothetical protein